MSQFPPPVPQDALPYYTPAMPPPKLRPTSVTVVAVTSIVLGSLALLGTLCTVPQYLGVSFGPNPVMDEMRRDALWMTINFAGLALGTAIGIIQLWGGISALSLKKSGRALLNAWAIAYIVMTVVSVVLTLTFVNPRMENVKFGNAAQQAQIQGIMRMGQYGALCFGVLIIGWAATVLYLLSRPHVKEAFERGMTPPSASPYMPTASPAK